MDEETTVPVEYLIDSVAKEMKIQRGEIESHLVLLGIGVLMSLHYKEQPEGDS